MPKTMRKNDKKDGAGKKGRGTKKEKNDKKDKDRDKNDKKDEDDKEGKPSDNDRDTVDETPLDFLLCRRCWNRMMKNPLREHESWNCYNGTVSRVCKQCWMQCHCVWVQGGSGWM